MIHHATHASDSVLASELFHRVERGKFLHVLGCLAPEHVRSIFVEPLPSNALPNQLQPLKIREVIRPSGSIKRHLDKSAVIMRRCLS